MAVTVYVRDLENYPDIQKTITVNLSQLVPVGQDADEKWLVSCSTSAYSNNTDRTAIQDIYINQIYRGWARSDGLVGSTFTISSSNNKLKVKVDNASGTYIITLATGTNLTGEDVAEDIETKLRALSETGGDQAANLSYKGSSCEWKDNKLWIYSGTADSSYTASGRTSVELETTSNDARATLGFDTGLTSYWLGSNPTKAVSTTTTVSAGDGTVSVNSGLGVTGAGHACKLTDGGSSENFITDAGATETTLTVTGTSITGTYAVGSKVVLLQEGDADYPIASSFRTIDDSVRWALESIIEQVDFSS